VHRFILWTDLNSPFKNEKRKAVDDRRE